MTEKSPQPVVIGYNDGISTVGMVSVPLVWEGVKWGAGKKLDQQLTDWSGKALLSPPYTPPPPAFSGSFPTVLGLWEVVSGQGVASNPKAANLIHSPQVIP